MTAAPPSAPSPVRANQTRMRQTRRWLPYFGALVLVGLIVAGLWPQPVPVETARAAFGPLRTTVNEEGKTRIRHRFVVSAPVTGQLRRIGLKAGAEVLGNETVVATLDPISPALLDARTRSLAEARRDSAAANLEKARAAHEFAASELKRFEKLHRDGTVSIQEWEAAQWREASASRDRAAADSALRQAEAELAVFAAGSSTNHPGNPAVPPVEVRAPTSGRVLRVFEENARVVGVGSPLLEIGDPADLEVVVEVLSRDAAVIRPGARVQLDQWGGSQPLEARVRLIEPAGFTKVSALGVEEQRVNVIADLVSPPELRANLGDAFRVVARIVTSETDRALCVPSGALFRRGDAWAVFVVNHRRAHLRRVQAGRSSGMETEVVEGLQEGDAVVLYPGDRIRDGQRVKRLAI